MYSYNELCKYKLYFPFFFFFFTFSLSEIEPQKLYYPRLFASFPNYLVKCIIHSFVMKLSMNGSIFFLTSRINTFIFFKFQKMLRCSLMFAYHAEITLKSSSLTDFVTNRKTDRRNLFEISTTGFQVMKLFVNSGAACTLYRCSFVK